jgi:hypothetical protein
MVETNYEKEFPAQWATPLSACFPVCQIRRLKAMPHHFRPPAPPPRQKSPEELLREAANTAAVAVVKSGFDAIDQLTELGKNHLKKAILRGISGRTDQP